MIFQDVLLLQRLYYKADKEFRVKCGARILSTLL